jgi:RNA polymerase sigma-70 factor (ECF subfamily)
MVCPDLLEVDGRGGGRIRSALLLVGMSDATPRPSAVDAPWVALRAALARAVRRQCPRWLASAAEDIVQAALVKVIESARRRETERTLSSFYLYRVAHSELVDEIRRRNRRREVAMEEVGPSGDEQAVVDPALPGDPEQDAALQELGLAVRDCLMAMKRERRLAVALYLEGHAVPEAARLLEWPEKRTKNLIYRGLADLRELLLAKGHRP